MTGEMGARMSMRGWWWAAAMALGGMTGAAACTDGATIQEACAVVCACEESLPSAQRTCEAACVAQPQESQACLECIVAVEECSRLAATCSAECD